MQHQTTHITDWLDHELKLGHYDITPLKGDASFRRYFRIETPNQTFILMDAPPTKECSKTFIQIATLLHENHIHAPHIYQKNLDQGLLLLEDFGDDDLLSFLTPHNAELYYHIAIDIICALQRGHLPSKFTIPRFDKTLMMNELMLFQDWFLKKLLDYHPTAAEENILQTVFQYLISRILKQPYVLTHRDFHSRNLMRLSDNALGVLDFQDMVIGPMTYDIVSLLKDAYITWPHEQQKKWFRYFYQQQIAHHMLPNQTYEALWQDFELVGLQRHIKVVGIFARLFKRDGKMAYLKDIPRVMDYIVEVSPRYEALQAFHQLMVKKFIPLFQQTALSTSVV